MATTLKSWMDAGTAIPKAIETKFTKLPKLSTQMLKFDAMIPAGPAIYPDPPAAGLPKFGLDKLSAPPNIYGSPIRRNLSLTPGMPVAQRLDVSADIPFAIIPPRTIRDTQGGNQVTFMGMHEQPTFTFK